MGFVGGGYRTWVVFLRASILRIAQGISLTKSHSSLKFVDFVIIFDSG